MNRGGPLRTTQDIMHYLRRLLAEPGPSRFSDETLYAFINLAAHEVSEDTGASLAYHTVPAVTGQDIYDIQQQLFHLVSVLAVRYYPDPANRQYFHVLQWVSPEEMEKCRGTTTGVPCKYSIYDKIETLSDPTPLQSRLVVYPTPSENGEIEILASVIAATAEPAERADWPPVVRRAWRDLVIIKAMAYCYENLGRPDMAAERNRAYEQMLSGVRLRILNHTTSNYEQIFDVGCPRYV